MSLAFLTACTQHMETLEKLATPYARTVGADSEDVGMAALLHCLLHGVSAIDFARQNNMISNRCSMKADAMLADFRVLHGGSHTVSEKSEDRAAVILINKEGEMYESELTWEFAQQGRHPWKKWSADADKTKLELKLGWSTPWDRRNMLWARCVSDAIRTFCPEVAAGVYTPEEMQPDWSGPVTQVSAEAANFAGALQSLADQEMPTTDEEVSVEPEQIAEEAPPEKEPDPDPEEPKEPPLDTDPNGEDKTIRGCCTKAQRDKIRTLFSDCEIGEDVQKKHLAKYGIGALNGLTKEQADEWITKLSAHKRELAGN